MTTTTTILLEDDTFELLKEYKELSNAENYDKLIFAMTNIWLERKKYRQPLKTTLPKGSTKQQLLKDIRKEKERQKDEKYFS
ncbi:MAG: hypothetical protein WC595_04490 [Candidatus Nanoarchaeia archaeon]